MLTLHPRLTVFKPQGRGGPAFSSTAKFLKVWTRAFSLSAGTRARHMRAIRLRATRRESCPSARPYSVVVVSRGWLEERILSLSL